MLYGRMNGTQLKGIHMSDWANDIMMMHNRFGVREWFEANKDNTELMQNYLAFRMSMVKEEFDEKRCWC